MKFGAFFVLQSPEWLPESQVIGEALDQIEWAEELGFDNVWIGEHHFSRHGMAGSPLQLLTYAAGRTRRIRLGLAVAILPFNHPIQIAEQSAMLDIVSNGRLDFGIGRGYLGLEFKAFGRSMSDGTSLFRESFEIIRRAWTEERVTYNGEHYRLDDLRIAPKPIQQPHPPVYMASSSSASLAWAAENGIRIMQSGLTPLDDLKKFRKQYREDIARHGFNQSLYTDSPFQRQVLVADTTKEARAIATPALDWLAATSAKAGNSAVGGSYAKGYEYYEQLDKIRRERAAFKWTDDAWTNLETTPIVGDPEEVTRRLSAVQSALDLGSFMSWSGFGGIPHSTVMRSMELFAREVMPRFRTTTSSEAVTAGAKA